MKFWYFVVEVIDRLVAPVVSYSCFGLRWLRIPRARRIKVLPDRLESLKLQLPCADQPEASVIIPVYGRADITWHCLEALARTDAGRAYEVIVVDDASPDDTPKVLSRVQNINVVRAADNGGFIAACLQGAAEARAPVLVFLNNDTEVTEHWLNELLDTLNPSVGIVGARLLFGYGAVQEAGGIVFKDGTGSHYGRRQWPSESTDYAREVDYVSGACLAIRKKDWVQLNGFDERYRPAYYEDTDLCFRMRQMGYSVWVQPAAQVFHLEGATYRQGKKHAPSRHHVVNRSVFVKQWQAELQTHPTPGVTQRRNPYTGSRNRGIECLVVGQVEVDILLRTLGLLLKVGGHPVVYAWTMRSALRQKLQKMGCEVLTKETYGSRRAMFRSQRAARVQAVLCLDEHSALVDVLRLRLPQAAILSVGFEGKEFDGVVDSSISLEALARVLASGPRRS
ncbi:MAG: glycosyltransferase family 2 protein [Myxococcales bacterium]|nr:glycosyltransferase family 2 protein [Myxococcales bacterium]